MMDIEILDPCFEFLRGRQTNVTSQWGEDGVLAALFARIGEGNRWCFEVGAADGELWSNTKALRDADWCAVLIESDPVLFARLVRHERSSVRCIYDKATPENLDRILSHCGAPVDLDLGIIDVDGMDYWVWDGLRIYRPRVMLVEFAECNGPDHICDRQGEGRSADQSSRQPILDLGIRKGYRPVAVTGYNVTFVREETAALS